MASFNGKENTTVTARPKGRWGRLLLAALATAPVAAPAPTFAQDAGPAATVRDLPRLGEHPFAPRMQEALDDAHLERVFAASLREGTLVAADRDAFFASARMQRTVPGPIVSVAPGTQMGWMTGTNGYAGAGPEQLRWAGTQPFSARTFDVTRANGTVVKYGIVLDTVDGVPCYNVFPVSATPAVARPDVRPLAVAAVESPCPPRSAISIEGLPANSDVTVVYAVRQGGRQLRTVDGAECPGITLPEVCGDCTTEVSTGMAREIADALRERVQLLNAQTYHTSDGSLRVDIPATIRIPLRAGGFATIDFRAALRDGTIVAALSCPRNERGRGHGNAGILEQTDLTQSRAGRSGEETLSMRWNGASYRVAPQQ